MIKAILFIWIGVAQHQTMSMANFDSLADCEAAKSALLTANNGWTHSRLKEAQCIAYKSGTQ